MTAHSPGPDLMLIQALDTIAAGGRHPFDAEIACREASAKYRKTCDLNADLLVALKTLAEHASETYPHFEDTRGQADIAAARAAIARAEGNEVAK
jgi:hypothetical protein